MPRAARGEIGIDKKCILTPVDGVMYQSFPMLERARAQVWFYSPKFRRPRHFHAEQELNLVVCGVATFGVGDSEVEASAGDLLSFPPGQDHVLLQGSPDLALFAIGMQADFSLDVLRGEPHAIAAPFRARLSRRNLDALVERAEKLAEQARVEQQIAELWEAAQHARRNEGAPSSSTPHVLTRRALSTISLDPELGRAELARISRTSPSEISRHFHRDIGMTLVDYRTRIRLLRFIQAVDRAGNFTTAALEAGFGSYSQCHRSFQASFSCSPRSFFMPERRREMEDKFEPSSGGEADLLAFSEGGRPGGTSGAPPLNPSSRRL